jgi:hypothetical protein
MAESNLNAIVDRAATDEKFRRRLEQNPKSVAKEYGLTEEELKQLLDNPSEEFCGELEVRISKRRVGGLTGPMGIDGVEE